MFEIKRPPGSNVTLNCTRTCGFQVYDTWNFSLGNQTDFNNTDRSGLTEYFWSSDVKLTLCNHNDYEGCDDEIIEYSLTIHNVTEELNGLIVTCGALNNNTNIQWTASHSVLLTIGKQYTVQWKIFVGGYFRYGEPPNETLTTS